MLCLVHAGANAEGRHKWIEVKGFEEFLGRTEGATLSEMQVDVS